MHTECLADALINIASLWYSGERPIYAECAVTQTDCHSGMSCMPNVLLMNSSRPNRHGNQGTTQCMLNVQSFRLTVSHYMPNVLLMNSSMTTIYGNLENGLLYAEYTVPLT